MVKGVPEEGFSFSGITPLPDVALDCGCRTANPKSEDCRHCLAMNTWLNEQGVLNDSRPPFRSRAFSY